MADAIGERIRRLRISRKMTLRALAHEANVPISTLSAIESGMREGENLTLKTGKRLALALGISLDVIAGVYDKEETESKMEAAVQVWIVPRPCTGEEVLTHEDLTVEV